VHCGAALQSPVACVSSECLPMSALRAHPVDCPCLFTILINRQHQATVQQLFVDLDCVVVRKIMTGLRRDIGGLQAFPSSIFAGAGNRENRFALEQLQSIGCALCAFFFHDGQICFESVSPCKRVTGRSWPYCTRCSSASGQHCFHQRALSAAELDCRMIASGASNRRDTAAR